ncbi:SSS family solute:Na+ symporter [Pullulanibacillus pueri]|uniref:Sodium:solute symporter n=1 Tax=Pullulanibacillus pueri TaxID=1437324 RepID=A0A8J2ZUS6_9BACL|nr:sodium:solute symporter [Pullulanibacillus pueri]MBM7682067.1 SSS family solute:Na+ symporter [Pullulanibacillus pueri]GGH80105.1 sodium:solute symporter [Pullulanibacillus pueri]
MNWSALIVFVIFFVFVTVLGFYAARWRRGDLTQLDEWGLGGRKFGTLVTWFLLGGDLYTAYTFIAVPALMYGSGAMGFYAVPYTILIYPFIFVVMPRLWSVSRKHGYVTASDFVRGRFNSSSLALAVAITGILATMPYIALQLVGMQAVISAMGFGHSGLSGELPLIIAFVILAIYTYSSGLRAPASIAIVKDIMIYITIIVAMIVIPIKLGGLGHMFDAAKEALAAKNPPGSFILDSKSFFAYGSLALGSALALFLYPHSLTGVLSSNHRNTIRKNAAILPAYSLVLGFITLLGFMALAAGIKVQGNDAIPALFLKMLPDWFNGFAFAAIAIGALVPAAIMSIASANLFSRNIYREYINPNCTPEQESKIAKLISLIVKVGALVFILFFPKTYAINLQLLGGIWILQTFPAIIVGLYTNWFNKWALVIGWFVGMATGTWMAFSQNMASTYPLHIFGATIPGYAAIFAVIVNFIVTVILTFIFRAMGMENGGDQTTEEDYKTAS